LSEIKVLQNSNKSQQNMQWSSLSSYIQDLSMEKTTFFYYQ